MNESQREAIVTKNISETKRLEEFILADFETYGLTAEDLEVWFWDALAVGKIADYRQTLREVIEGGSDWGMSE